MVAADSGVQSTVGARVKSTSTCWCCAIKSVEPDPAFASSEVIDKSGSVEFESH